MQQDSDDLNCSKEEIFNGSSKFQDRTHSMQKDREEGSEHQNPLSQNLSLADSRVEKLNSTNTDDLYKSNNTQISRDFAKLQSS